MLVFFLAIEFLQYYEVLIRLVFLTTNIYMYFRCSSLFTLIASDIFLSILKGHRLFSKDTGAFPASTLLVPLQFCRSAGEEANWVFAAQSRSSTC